MRIFHFASQPWNFQKSKNIFHGKSHFPLGSLNIPISCWNLQKKFPIGKLYFPRSENFCIEKWIIRIGKLILPNQVGNREFPWSEWFSLEYWKFQVGNSSFANKLNYEWNNNHSIRESILFQALKNFIGILDIQGQKIDFPYPTKEIKISHLGVKGW